MRIHLINPNTSKGMTQHMALTARQVAAPNTHIEAVTAKMGPVTIESHFDEAMSVIGIADAINAGEQVGVDGYILSCFGDPAIWAVRELTEKPVLGIAQASFIMASMISKRFAVVTSLNRTITVAEHLLESYGMKSLCAGVLAIDLPVSDIEGDIAVKETIRQARYAKDTLRAGAVVLGCGGMTAKREYIENEARIPVIDGVVSAVKLLEAMHALGIKTSKVNDLAYPIAKAFTGDLSRFGSNLVG